MDESTLKLRIESSCRGGVTDVFNPLDVVNIRVAILTPLNSDKRARTVNHDFHARAAAIFALGSLVYTGATASATLPGEKQAGGFRAT